MARFTKIKSVFFKVKTFRVSKDFIGKPVPLTPTLLGWAILNQNISYLFFENEEDLQP